MNASSSTQPASPRPGPAHPGPTLPSAPAVFVEQIRSVGLAIRREGLAFVGGIGGLLLLLAIVLASPTLSVAVASDAPPALHLEDLGFLAAWIGLAFPILVWKDEAPWKDTPLWGLPVAHSHHALAKIAAGWIWLLGVLALGLAALNVAVGMAGGSVGPEVTRLLLADPIAAAAMGGAGASRAGIPETVAVTWQPPLYHWAMPFTAGSVVYLLGSALWVGSRHPLRWVVTIWLALLSLAFVLGVTEVTTLEAVADGVLGSVDQVLAGGSETTRRGFRADSGEWTTAWVELPTFRRWAAATALWLAAGGIAVLVAVRRHRRR